MHWTESTHAQCVQYTLFEFGHGLYFFCPFIILIIIIISFCAKRVFISVPFVWIFFSSSGQCFAVRCAHNVKISRYWCVRKSLSASVRWALAFMRSRHTQVKKPLCAKLNDSNLKNNFFFFRSRIFNRNILNLPDFFFCSFRVIKNTFLCPFTTTVTQCDISSSETVNKDRPRAECEHTKTRRERMGFWCVSIYFIVPSNVVLTRFKWTGH